jgi:hypothetical protein
MNKRTAALGAAALAAAVTLTACTGMDDRSVHGTVKDKSEHYYSGVTAGKVHTSGHWERYVYVEDAGREVRVQVSSQAYDRCYRGSSYPHCLDVKR